MPANPSFRKLSLAFSLILTLNVYAQDVPISAQTSKAISQALKVNIRELAFMTGTWTQKHEWGDMEEFWGPPMGDNMICSYRCVKDGKVLFYEFIVIEQSDSVPVMRLRHFKPGNIGWEEKDKPIAYPLVALDHKKATFESPSKTLRMTYSRINHEKMDILLEEKNKQGELETTVFNYTLRSAGD